MLFAEEGYFKGNKYFRPELVRAHDGVLGDPAPYNVGNDNVVQVHKGMLFSNKKE